MDSNSIMDLIKAAKLTGAFPFPDRGIRYFQEGHLHREGGPAVIGPYGEQWYRDGKLHRDDGPAVEMMDGCKEWWVNGYLHREEGPAVINANGSMEWWRKPPSP